MNIFEIGNTFHWLYEKSISTFDQQRKLELSEGLVPENQLFFKFSSGWWTCVLVRCLSTI